MAKKKYELKEKEIPVEELIVEEKKDIELKEKKYILKKDMNLSFKKGMEVSEKKYKELVGTGFGFLFE